MALALLGSARARMGLKILSICYNRRLTPPPRGRAQYPSDWIGRRPVMKGSRAAMSYDAALIRERYRSPAFWALTPTLYFQTNCSS